MFSVATHILTLLAFTAHAVLGCCGHHGHATFGHTATATCCQKSAAATATGQQQIAPESSQGDCCASKPHSQAERTAPDHHADTHPCGSDASESVPTCPCDNDGQCQGSTCAYVTGDCQCFQVHVDLLSLEWAVSQNAVRCELSQLEAHSWAAQASSTHYQSSGALCALFQTWQV